MGRKAAAAEVLGQLPLEVVGDTSAALGDEAPGLLLDAALPPTLQSRRNAPKSAFKNAPARARRGVPRLKLGNAAQLNVAG